MGRGRRTGSGNRYFRNGGVRKARLKTNRFVPERCNSRAASLEATPGMESVWRAREVREFRPKNVLPAEPNRLTCVSQTGNPRRETVPLSDHAPRTKYSPTSKRNGFDPLYKQRITSLSQMN